MFYFDQSSAGIARGIARSVGVLLMGASVASCGTSGRAEAIQESSPSVTYSYTDDAGLVDATIQAEAYCRQFNAWPTTTSLRQASDGDGNVTFVCDQTRSVAYTGGRTASMPTNPTVNYTYRDERSLIDATSEAQRHCAGFGAYARSSTVTMGTDGTRTVVFECVRSE
jgi:hypothetical protein